jgi:four helix bundle protein
MHSFEDLEIWKECRKLRIEVSKLLITLPPEEKYRLVDQLIRSSRSVTANIAEGHGRYHYQENIQFCRQARGSLNEVFDHLITALDEEYINTSQLEAYREIFNQALKLLNGYILFLKNKKTETR